MAVGALTPIQSRTSAYCSELLDKSASSFYDIHGLWDLLFAFHSQDGPRALFWQAGDSYQHKMEPSQLIGLRALKKSGRGCLGAGGE